MKKFLKDLEKELLKLKINKKEIAEILADHNEMIKEAQKEGLTDDEITNKFGNPVNLAEDLAKDTNRTTINSEDYVNRMSSEDVKGYELFKSLPVLDPVTEVSIGAISEDIMYYPHDLETIDVFFKNIDNPKKYTATVDNGVFTFKRESVKLSFSMSRSVDERIIIKVPKDLVLNLFTLSIVSSDVEILGVESDKVKIKSTSGDIKIEGLKVGEGSISTVSGDYEIADFEAHTINLSAVSGDFEIENGRVSTELVMQTVSGDFELSNVEAGETTFQSVSGDLEGNEFYPSLLNLKSVSGDIEITNNDKTKEIKIGRKRTLSGDIEIN